MNFVIINVNFVKMDQLISAVAIKLGFTLKPEQRRVHGEQLYSWK